MQMTISDLKILMAGFGSIGKRHTNVLQQLGARHLAVFDPSDEGARYIFFDDTRQSSVR